MRLICKIFMDKWGVRWQRLTTCRQTKLWKASPGCLGKNILKLDRQTVGLILQALIGHNYLNYHRSIVDQSHSSVCRFCEEEREEFTHLVLARERQDCFQDQPPNLAGIIRFIKVDRIDKALD